MKGRITCKQVNTAVDELNKAFDAKYTLMKTSKSHLTDAMRRSIREYKDQEKKETKGMSNCYSVPHVYKINKILNHNCYWN